MASNLQPCLSMVAKGPIGQPTAKESDPRSGTKNEDGPAGLHLKCQD